ncbi:hypothetical protein F2Q70_00038107 [Brassica cretica]|uniref:Uncharacterized protein n=1 Tax=Brassica cretica TaxID=69181 RepID=A0A8S9K4A6_BRACR|nr:hypothetical protein F2Q70_00038107 [Brassica cretica]
MVEADRHDGEVRRPPKDGSGGQNTELKTPKTSREEYDEEQAEESDEHWTEQRARRRRLKASPASRKMEADGSSVIVPERVLKSGRTNNNLGKGLRFRKLVWCEHTQFSFDFSTRFCCGGPGGSDISGGYREKGQVIDDGCDKQTHVACLCYISVAFFALLFVVVAEEEKCLAIV